MTFNSRSYKHEADHAQSGPSLNQRQRILLVTDSEALQSKISELLSEQDFLHVDTGAVAIATLMTEPIAVVVLDLRMSGMEGYSVINFMLQNDPKRLRSVIALSTREETVFRSIFAFIRWPFETQELLSALQACLAEHSLQG